MSTSKLKSLIFVTLAGYGTYTAVSLYRGDEIFYKNYFMPLVRVLDAEKAHKVAVLACEYRLFPKSTFKDPDILKVKVFGHKFPNPIGIAAGFDKDGTAILGLRDIGFGFVEIGSVTPKPQSGNQKPRVFRLVQDFAIINRYGFNSEGHEKVLKRIMNVKQDTFSNIVGVNLGKNKTSPDAIQDYIDGINTFGVIADYLVINISSPNTPGLRDLQGKDNLRKLLKALVEAKNNLPLTKKPPLLLKLAPDLTDQQKRDIATVLKEKDCKVDGLIISNTTSERPKSLKSAIIKNESGGLSGAPLKDMSTKMIAEMSKLTGGMPIIGVGGISSGADAYEKIKAGATLLQLYTAMTYEGPPIVCKVKKELVELLKKDGYKNVADAVGKGVR